MSCKDLFNESLMHSSNDRSNDRLRLLCQGTRLHFDVLLLLSHGLKRGIWNCIVCSQVLPVPGESLILVQYGIMPQEWLPHNPYGPMPCLLILFKLPFWGYTRFTTNPERLEHTVS